MIDTFPGMNNYREISGNALAKPVAHLQALAKPVAHLSEFGQESVKRGLTGGEIFAGHFASGVNVRA